MSTERGPGRPNNWHFILTMWGLAGALVVARDSVPTWLSIVAIASMTLATLVWMRD